MKWKYLLVATLVFLALTAPVLADSSTFLNQAQSYINSNCSNRRISNTTALLCYLFYRSQEQASAISNMQATLSPVPSQISSLQTQTSQIDAQQAIIAAQANRIASLEALLAPPQEIDIFPTQTFSNGQESSVIDTAVRRQIVIEGESEQQRGGFNLYYSDDNSTWTEEGGIVVASGTSIERVQKVFPVKGKHLKVVVGVASSPFTGWATLTLY